MRSEIKMQKEGECNKSNLITSALESVSASLCLMSFAIEKKTSSTFKFVLALWHVKWLISFYCEANKYDQCRQSKLTIFGLQFQRTWFRIHQQVLDPLLLVRPETKYVLPKKNAMNLTNHRCEWNSHVLCTIPSCSRPYRLCSLLRSCWHYRKRAARCYESSS